MSNLALANQIEPKTYKNERVVTFKDIDLVHERVEGTASRNFKTNRKYFVENEDYYLVTPKNTEMDEIRLFGINSPRGGILITESGYLLLVKSFTDELSWQVQKALVKTYFRVKETPEQTLPVRIFYYENIPCTTVKEIGKLCNCSLSTVRSHIKKNLKYGDDWLELERKNLMKFKMQYPESKVTNSLIIVSIKAYRKLTDVLEFMGYLKNEPQLTVTNNTISKEKILELARKYPNISEKHLQEYINADDEERIKVAFENMDKYSALERDSKNYTAYILEKIVENYHNLYKAMPVKQ